MGRASTSFRTSKGSERTAEPKAYLEPTEKTAYASVNSADFAKVEHIVTKDSEMDT